MQNFPHDQMEVVVVQDAGGAPLERLTRERVRNIARYFRRSGIGNFRFEAVSKFLPAPVGHGEMFNIILALAQGVMIMSVDSDDFVGPSHVRELHDAWRRSHADAVSANCEKRWFDADGKELSKRPEPVWVTAQNYADFGALIAVNAERARATGGLIRGAYICEDREWLTRSDDVGRRLISWAPANIAPGSYTYVQHTYARPGSVDREAEWQKLLGRLARGELRRPTNKLPQCDDLEEYFRVRPLPQLPVVATSTYRGHPSSVL